MVIFRPNLQSQPLYTFLIFLLKKGSVDPYKQGRPTFRNKINNLTKHLNRLLVMYCLKKCKSRCSEVP